jgi:arylformamidase
VHLDRARQSGWRIVTAEIDYEVEYNNRARVPEHPALIAGWAHDAKAWREQQRFHTIAYGPGARHTIDVFPARGEGDLVVFIHGGYWQALDGSFFSHLAAGLNAHGVSVAIPSYDLCPQVSIEDITAQMRLARFGAAARPCKGGLYDFGIVRPRSVGKNLDQRRAGPR